MNLNRLHILAMALCAVLTSCSNDDAGGGVGLLNNRIGFSAIIHQAQGSRGALITDANDKVNFSNFGFFVKSTSEGYKLSNADNMHAMRSSATEWEYQPALYWAADNSVAHNFWAYAPFVDENSSCGLSIETVDNTDLAIRYVIPEDVAKQPDFMVAEPVQQSSGDVKFVFSHQLSAITFEVGDGISISSISIMDVASEALFTQSGTTTKWIEHKYTSGNEFVAGVIDDTYLVEGSQIVSTDDGNLMMIPQTIPTNAAFKIVYEQDGIVQTKYFKIAGKEWLANYRYIYCFGVDPVDFEIVYDPEDVVVLPWVEYEDDEIIGERK